MKYLFYLGHPAHFHLFKNIINKLEAGGHTVSVLIKKKDILEELLQRCGMGYENILPKGRRDTKGNIALGFLKRGWRLFRYCMTSRPDLLIGTSAEIGLVGAFLRIPSVNVNEDDAGVVPLYSKISYPWCNQILSPLACDNGKWASKTIQYEGYHELAYLHPDHFTPSRQPVNAILATQGPFFIIRFSRLAAYHDAGMQGISNDLALKVIDILRPRGQVFISSERELCPELETYRIRINPLDVHHVMAFASLYIGDSQTMAAEAGVLGTPFVRFNDFVGRIGYLNELEKKYQLGFGIKSSNPERLLSTIEQLVNTGNLKVTYEERKTAMLREKIDVAKFMMWFFEEYPDSVRVMREQPEYHYRFRSTPHRN